MHKIIQKEYLGKIIYDYYDIMDISISLSKMRRVIMEVLFITINLIIVLILIYKVIKYVLIFTTRNIKTNNNFLKNLQNHFREKSIGFLKVRVITYVLLALIFNLTAGTFIGYTSMIGIHDDNPGIYTIEELHSHTSNVFIGELDYIIDDRSFNPFLPIPQDGGLNYTFYHFQVYENIEGLLISREMIVNTHFKTIIPIPDPPRYVVDFPKDHDMNTVYLFFCNHHSSEYSHLENDYRNREGDNYYLFASIELTGYNSSLPLNEQSQDIQTLVESYLVFDKRRFVRV